jgi:hypothetical protein
MVIIIINEKRDFTRVISFRVFLVIIPRVLFRLFIYLIMKKKNGYLYMHYVEESFEGLFEYVDLVALIE